MAKLDFFQIRYKTKTKRSLRAPDMRSGRRISSLALDPPGDVAEHCAMTRTEILTPRLRLRRARVDDLEAMHAVLSHPLATRYWSTPPHEHIEQTREWLASMIEAPGRRSFDYIVEHEGRCIGKCGMYEVPEIGFILHPDHWGRGLAAEALQAVIGKAFECLPLYAVIADVDPRNQASLALLKKMGFRETSRAARTWLIAGEYCDSIYLALPRSAVDENGRGPSGATPSV
jgi:RimJ/RimL family protein N-acetyltransferase